MTGDGWSDITRQVMTVYPSAWIFFVCFVLICTFVVVNLFIAVVVSAMDEEEVEVSERILAELAELRRRSRSCGSRPRPRDPGNQTCHPATASSPITSPQPGAAAGRGPPGPRRRGASSGEQPADPGPGRLGDDPRRDEVGDHAAAERPPHRVLQMAFGVGDQRAQPGGDGARSPAVMTKWPGIVIRGLTCDDSIAAAPYWRVSHQKQTSSAEPGQRRHDQGRGPLDLRGGHHHLHHRLAQHDDHEEAEPLGQVVAS